MINTQNLTKRYGKMLAVNEMNLSIGRGTVFGLVGENGAGKTTALSMLATLSTPTSGHAYINDYEVSRNPREVRQSIGYMPDSFGVYDDLTVTEYLRFFADCYQVHRPTIHARTEEYLERVNLMDKRHTYVNALSRGMQQRLEIARCLMHDPEVLILDEPASGLDPRSRIEMREVLHSLRALGKTIVISTHILHELAEVADEIGILRGGELVAVAAIQVMLQHSNAYRTVSLTTIDDGKWVEQLLLEDKQVLSLETTERGFHLLYAGTEVQQAKLLKHLIDSGVRLTEFAEKPTDIEELFLRLSAVQEGFS